MAENKDLGKSSISLQPNIAGLLCYALGWLSGLVFYLIEKENKFVRFHALQSLVFFGALTVLGIGLGILSAIMAAIRLSALVPVIILLSNLIWLASLVVWILLMFKAYKGERFKLPIAGDIAEKNS